MHLKLKDFGSLIDCNCRISRDKNLICTELCLEVIFYQTQSIHVMQLRIKIEALGASPSQPSPLTEDLN